MIYTLGTILIGVAVIAAGVILLRALVPDPARSSYEEILRGAKGTADTPPRVSVGRLLAGSLAIVIGIGICIAAFGWTQVSSGQVGIVSTNGKVDEQPLDPGLTWRIPIITSVVVMDTTRRATYAFDKIESFTKENQPANLTGLVNYHLDPESAPEVFQTFGLDWADKLIKSQVATELKADARSFAVDSITSQRDVLAQQAADALQGQVDVLGLGIRIDGITISDIALSPEYLAAVEKKQVAQQDLERAQIEAKTKTTQAQANADAQVIEAQGQADSNAKINASLTSNLISWQQINKLNPNVSVMMVPSNANLLLPVPTPAP